MIRRTGAVLIVLALVATGCRASKLKTVTGAAAAAKKQGSLKIEGRATAEGAFKDGGRGFAYTMRLDGVQQFDPQRGRMTVSFENGGAFAAAGSQEVLQEGTYTYLKAPPCPSGALDNKPWVRYDPFKNFGINPNSLGSTDPTIYLESLKGVGEVQEAGEEDVRGVATTRYTVKVDREKLLQTVAEPQRQMMEQLFTENASIAIDVWIDDEGLPRRFLTEVSGAGKELGLESFEMTITMEFFDYGTKVKVEIPPEDQVTTIESIQTLGAMCQGAAPAVPTGAGGY